MPAPVAGVDGAWSCAQCQNVNFAVRTVCNRCQAPQPSQFVPRAAGGGGAPVAGVDGNWACLQCTNINFALRTACNRCQAPRQQLVAEWSPPRQHFVPPPRQHFVPAPMPPRPSGGGGAPVAGVDGNWACHQCGNVNFAVRTACNRCQAPNFEIHRPQPVQPNHVPQKRQGGGPVAGVDGNWACPSCRNINFAMREACNRCQEPKPAEDPALVEEFWTCALCMHINDASAEQCSACHHFQGEDLESLAQELAGEPTQHQPQAAETRPRSHSTGGGAPEPGVDGAWLCPDCNNVNFAIRTACNRCHMPKPEEDTVFYGGSGIGGSGIGGPDFASAPQGKGKGAPVAGDDGNWLCHQCQNVNFAVRSVCNRCQAHKPAPRGLVPAGKGGPAAGVDGNWACPHCHNVNFAVRNSCNRCQAPGPMMHAPAPHRVVMPPQQHFAPQHFAPQHFAPQHFAPQHFAPQHFAPPPRVVVGNSGGKGGAPVAGMDGNWACVHCQNVNFAVREMCNRCQAPKSASVLPPPARASGGAPVAGVDGNWACPSCSNVNFAVRTQCNRCQAPQQAPMMQQAYQPARKAGGAPVPGVDGAWKCGMCANVNFAMREACNRCQEPMPIDADDAELLAQLSQPAFDDEPAAKRGRLH